MLIATGAVLLFAAVLDAQPLIGGDDGAGATAAALPDEASECRYLLRLCEDAEAARSEASRAIADAGSAIEATERSRSPSDLERATDAQRLARIASSRQGLARRKIKSAADVIAAKHQTPPACLKQCSELDENGKLKP
ncbi:MAG: hypothetical protein IT294_07200 [Deltaproteobacteria bacterium]|nr:hypothetical protein [Deltaproteobacteria bacterium]